MSSRQRVNIFLFIALSLILNIKSCFNPNAVSAVASCDQEPTYRGLEFPLPITDRVTCDAYDGDSSLFDQFIDQSDVRGVNNAELVGGYIGRQGFETQLQNVPGTGAARVDLDKNTNLAVDPAILDKKTQNGKTVNQELFTLKKSVSMRDNLDPVGINGECYDMGETDLVACADQLGATITYPSSGRKRINTFTAHTATQKLVTLRDQIAKKALARAKENADCQSEGAANDIHCGNNAVTKSGKNSSDIARENIQIINSLEIENGFEKYFDLPLSKRQQLLAQDNKKAQTTFLVVQKIPTNGSVAFFDIIFDNNNPFIIRGTNPGLPNIVDGLEEDFLRWNTLKEGQNQIAKIKGDVGVVAGVTTATTGQVLAATDGTAGGAAGLSQSAITKILNKIGGADCGPELTYSQLMGAISTSKSTGPAVIEWTFEFDNIIDALANSMHVFKACAIDPPEYAQISEFTSENKLAISKSYYLAGKAPSTKVDIHQEILSVPPTAGNEKDVVVDQKEIVCPTPNLTGAKCYDDVTETIRTEYSDNEASLQHEGGEFAWNLMRNTYKGALLTLSNPERFNQCSYAKDIQIRQPEKYALLETSTLNTQPAQCPIEPSTLMCTDLSKLEIKSDCTLKCDNVWGYPIPPSLKELVERLGSAYNIPPGLILGAMAAEGGFEPRCAGEKQIYTEEDIQAIMCTPNQDWCDSCNAGSGPFGSNPAYFQKTIDQARNTLGLPAGEGNLCSLADGGLMTAHGMSYQAGFNPVTWYPFAIGAIPNIDSKFTEGVVELQDSCQGIPYSGVPANSCSSWNDSQAITAIRLQQGFCGAGNHWMEIHTQQILDVFHSCK